MPTESTYEDRLQIQTPEGVELSLTLAGGGSRFPAAVLDQLIKWGLMLAFSVLFAATDALTAGALGLGVSEDGETSAFALAALVVALFAIEFGYDVLFEVLGGGRTPGKMAVGLRVVRATGGPITFVPSAIRNLMRLIDVLPFFYGVGLAAVAITRRNQRLGDLAAGTLVIRERSDKASSGAASGWHPAYGPPPQLVAGWDVSAISADEAAFVNQYLGRRFTLDAGPRRALSEDLAGRLRPRVAGAPAHLDAEQFLEGVAAAKAARG